MLLDLLMVLGGGALLYFGAEWLVGGSAGLARQLGVRPLVIGLTVVAYGTSMPELAVSAVAAVEGRGAIAVGNVIGSNIANIGLILGVVALISPPKVDPTLIRREVPVLVIAALVLPLFMWDGIISRLEGVLLVAGAIAFTAWTLRAAKEIPSSGELAQDSRAEVDREAKAGPRGKLIGLAALGLALLLVGGKVFVEGAVGLATTIGMSERVVGLTIVAVGTSLPELAASLIASIRGHSAIAIGNVVGSNIFNILLILGASALIQPIAAPFEQSARDLGVLIGITVFAALVLRSERLVNRIEGALMASAYAGFLVHLALG